MTDQVLSGAAAFTRASTLTWVPGLALFVDGESAAALISSIVTVEYGLLTIAVDNFADTYCPSEVAVPADVEQAVTNRFNDWPSDPFLSMGVVYLLATLNVEVSALTIEGHVSSW